MSAAESDTVWDKFLPHDIPSILSHSSSSSSSSKNELYLTLCENPILIDGLRYNVRVLMDDELLPVWMFLPAYALCMQMFFLDKWSGKKCYMISARDFMIPWGDSPDKWGWHSVADSRFEEVAELRSVWWLEIRGNIETRILSPSTVYQAYLVFKLSATADGFDRDDFVKVTVGLLGEEEASSKRAVFLDQEEVSVRTSETQYPKKMTDSWLEMEMGEFFCPGEEDGAIIEMTCVDAQNRRSWNNVNPTVNLHEM
ncbi:hypothetical protein ACFX19_010787 [Malus domestica]